jgi:hypothetical protein
MSYEKYLKESKGKKYEPIQYAPNIRIVPHGITFGEMWWSLQVKSKGGRWVDIQGGSANINLWSQLGVTIPK